MNRVPRKAAPVLVLALLAAAPAAVPQEAGEPGFSAAEKARLDRGATVVRLAPGSGSDPSEGFAARVLPRDAERVWRAVADLDHWHEWVPFLEVSDRKAGPGEAPAWELRFDLPLPLRDRHYRVVPGVGRATAPSGAAATLSWDSVPGSGNVARAGGSFTVASHPRGGTLVVFRTVTDTGDRTPRFLLDRALRESLAWVLEGLAQQVNRCRYTLPRPEGCREAPARPLHRTP